MRTARYAFVLSSIWLAGCPNGKKQAPAPATDEALKPLSGMRVVMPKDTRDADGDVTFAVGKLEGTLPRGWSTMSFGGQTTYRSPDFQETLRVVGYTSDAPLDEDRQRAIQNSLNELATRAERILGKFGAHVQLSSPQGGRTAWGSTSRFSALGPFNRVAFHYAAVAPHEAMMIQLDGNSFSDTPTHAVALIQSVKYKGEAP